MKLDKAVILAAGRGTRMRRAQNLTSLTSSQTEIARSGVKAMMPVGRPFIDYVLSGLADAGYHRVCLVIGPEHSVLREHCGGYAGGRLEVQFAVQHEATGTASAVAAASEFAGDESFLMINSDNYYPGVALVGLRDCSGSAVAGFHPEGLLRGNIRAERLRSFAILSVSREGLLNRVIEKPGKEVLLQMSGEVLIGMNCWRFTPAIFEACRKIPKSARGEYELTDAVEYAIQHLGERFSMTARY